MAKTVTTTQAPSVPGAGSWEALILQDLGVPVNATNLTALSLWAQSEGTVWANNPLAASGTGPGATTCIAQCGSSSPIMAYDTVANGAAWDAAFIKNNGYTGVISAFKGTTDQAGGTPDPGGLAQIWDSINVSGWCRGCQGGAYPEALRSALSQTPAELASIWSKIGSAIGSTGILPNPSKIAGSVGGAAGVASALDEAGKLLGDLTSTAWWSRVLIFVGGGALVVFGSILFLSTTKTGRTIEESAAQGAALGVVAA